MRAATTQVINYLNAVRAAPDGQMIMAGVFTTNQGAITGFQFLFSSGNVSTGTVKIYGHN